jgi:O-acetyl-ADP-ribose deacetylase (regulator of RNase III)
MNKSEKKRRLSNQQIENDLDEVMRRKAWLIPTTPTQVEEAEKLLGQTGTELPSSLADPKTLRHRLSMSERRLPSARPVLTRDDYWTHASVVTLAGNHDPVTVITKQAREVVLAALESGWKGPPYDPFALAELLKIRVVPSQEVVDARTTSNAAGIFTVEFNPNRPRARIRYSLAHEIAHTLFPDCALAVRHRGTHEQMTPDNWQLETLCNLAASEILMPMGSLTKEQTTQVNVDVVAELRKKFQVSSEAVLLRLTRLTDRSCLAFAARRDAARSRYFINYAVASRTWQPHIRTGFALPKNTKAHECTAIGYTTAKVPEQWLATFGEWCVQYLGIPPYPGESFPRVLGIASPLSEQPQQLTQITHVKGSAIEPRGTGNRIIVQVVNDRAQTWGAGFAGNVRKRWPELQARFTEWIENSRSEFRLGAVHLTEIEPTLYLASLVAQHGYGPSPKPRIRYRALEEALGKVSSFAMERNASLHMPRIGAGQAGGLWEIVSEITDEVVCRKGVAVTVYDLPDAEPVLPKQPPLLF